MTDSDSPVVEQTLHIRARPETVWRYWTDAERICDWWGSSADLDPHPGGNCRVVMGSGPVMQGEFLELVPHERIVFSLGWESTEGAPAVPPGSTRVEVTLAPDGADTIMTLRHTGLPVSHVAEHDQGWAYFLPLLAHAAASAAVSREC